jgi:chromosome segregation protein
VTEQQARSAEKAARTQLDERRLALAEAEREAGRVAARRSGLDEARSRLQKALAEAEAARETATAALAEVEDPGALAGEIDKRRVLIEAQRAEAAEARAAAEGLAREAEIRSGRLAAIAVERQGWHQRTAGAEAQLATLGARQADALAEQARLGDEPARIEARRTALLSEISDAEATRAAADDALASAEAALAEADRAARAAQNALAEAREAKVRAEERAAAAKDRLTELVRHIEDSLDCTPAELPAIAEIKPDQPTADVGDVEVRLERYRQERERLGAVNLRADGEASER